MSGRFAVLLDGSSEQVALRPENLILLDPADDDVSGSPRQAALISEELTSPSEPLRAVSYPPPPVDPNATTAEAGASAAADACKSSGDGGTDGASAATEASTLDTPASACVSERRESGFGAVILPCLRSSSWYSDMVVILPPSSCGEISAPAALA